MIFVDQTKITIESGRGGDGCVSFRREKYVPNGGPDGGDGGRGGNIIFVTDRSANTLYNFRHVRKYKADNGEFGKGSRCHGKDAKDLVIRVPIGTVIKEANSGKVIADLAHDEMEVTLLKGGRGGKGNQHYATPTMQIPKYAQPGQKSKSLEIILELKSIADVGLVGFPNVGKSTFLSRVTNAKPKIANYHFTTLTPNLGVVGMGDNKSFVIADIPGLIEGAAEGIGLGHEFLKHVERTKVLLHVVDAAGVEGRDPIDDIQKINKELEEYNSELLNKPQAIAANKLDVAYDDETINLLKEEFEPKGIKVFPISAVTGKGVKELLYHLNSLVDEVGDEVYEYEQEFFINEMTEVDEPIVVGMVEEGVFKVEGTRVARMIGYTNLEDEKGFVFFQNFLKENGILDKLEELGIEEGDTVIVEDLQFDYYK